MKSILDRTFSYAPAKSHEGSAEAFAKRQRERLEAARATAAEANAEQPTLRDRFAMAALTGIGADVAKRSVNESVALAYRVADAMLKERAK